MTQEELALFAQYAQMGGYENAGGYEDYDGSQDDFLEFSGAGGFMQEIENANRIQIQITNKQASAQDIYLCYYDRIGLTRGAGAPSENGNIRTVLSGTGFASVGGTSDTFLARSMTPNVTIEDFIAWIQMNPSRLLGFKVECTASDVQISNPLVMSKFSPFRRLADDVITPADVQNENTYRSKIATVPTPGRQLDGQTQIQYTLNASEVVLMTFYIGASLNTAKALDNKAAAVVGRNAQARPAAKTLKMLGR